VCVCVCVCVYIYIYSHTRIWYMNWRVLLDEYLFHSPICFCVSKAILKNFEIFLFFLLQINIFLVFLDHFDALISKIIFKNKKYYEKQLQPHFQTGTPLFHLYSQVTIIIIRIIIISTTTTYHVNYSSFWFLYMCFFFYQCIQNAYL